MSTSTLRTDEKPEEQSERCLSVAVVDNHYNVIKLKWLKVSHLGGCDLHQKSIVSREYMLIRKEFIL